MTVKPGILVVDHENQEREELVNILSRKFANYQVYSSENGEEALEVMKEHKIDVVLSALLMPKIDGLQLINRVNKEYPGTEILIMSELIDVDVARDLIQEGVAAYIRKPFESLDSVVHVVEKAIRRGASYSLINKEMMRLLLEALPEALIVFDKHKEVKFINQPGIQLLKDEGLGDFLLDYESIKKLLDTDIWELAQMPSPIKFIELSQVKYNLSALPIHPSGNDRFGYMVILRNISAKQHAEQLQRSIITLLAHEFRMPLTVLQSGLELIERGKIDEDKIKKISQSSRAQVYRITHLLENIVDLARIEAKALKLDPEKIDVKIFFKSLIKHFHATLDREGRKITVEYDSSLKRQIFADHKKMQQIFFNLVENALKFTPKGTPIAIKVNSDQNNLVVEVIDQGRGIPQEIQEKIFRVFVQGDGSLTHGISGAGLGLTIAKYLVEAHKGKIEIESKVGCGSIFRVVIPTDFRKS